MALGALLMILVAAPAGAVPPNEVLMARHLVDLVSSCINQHNIV